MEVIDIRHENEKVKQKEKWHFFLLKTVLFFKVIRSKTFFKNLIKRQKFRNERKDRE